MAAATPDGLIVPVIHNADQRNLRDLALEISHYGYVLETGRIILGDHSAALRQNPQVRNAYLGD